MKFKNADQFPRWHLRISRFVAQWWSGERAWRIKRRKTCLGMQLQIGSLELWV